VPTPVMFANVPCQMPSPSRIHVVFESLRNSTANSANKGPHSYLILCCMLPSLRRLLARIGKHKEERTMWWAPHIKWFCRSFLGDVALKMPQM
jgi:hypothetical protein